MTTPWEQRLSDMAPASAKIHAEAKAVLGGAMTHDIRFTRPFPLAVERAAGARKWDPNGNAYVDYVIGHGALILGHAHPAMVEAVSEQIVRGTHYGAAHRLEVDWAALVCDLMPAVERVRFTASGTEAVMLAVRLGRAFTDRSVVVKFDVHFHGWSEIGVVGLAEPFDVPASPGLPAGMTADVVPMPPRNRDAIEARLAQGDVAAVIVEPSGAHFGQIPVDAAFLTFLRDATRRHGALLIFDEVITGFRWSPGGAQERFGIAPDLTTMAKILGGGLPGGAVGGRADIMELLELRGDPDWDRYRHIYHPGTFNANPLSAAAGIAALREIATGRPTAEAAAAAARLRQGLNDVLRRTGVPGVVYGDSSVFHIYLGSEPSPGGRDQAWGSMRGTVGHKLRSAMLSRGVDLLVSGGMVSQAHGPSEIDDTVRAFDASVTELAAGGAIATQ